MVNNNINMHAVLSEFLIMARDFENALITYYKLENIYSKDIYFIGTVVPKKGEIPYRGKSLQFHFHGGGCTFNLENIHLQYNSSDQRNRLIEISVWPIHKFIISKSPSATITKDEVYALLEEQVKSGSLSRISSGLYTIKLPDRTF